MIVYLVENKRNGKRYVGLTKHDLETRWGQHVKDALYERSNMLLHKAIRKNGADGFVRTVIDTGESEEQLRQLEKDWIEVLGTHVSRGGYNLTLGGDGLLGYKHTAETKRRMSESRKGEQNPNFGKDWGFKWVDHSEKLKEFSESRVGEGNPFKGKHHSEEARKKIGEATALNKRKSVAQYTKTGDKVAIFNSMKEAAAAIGAPGLQKISDCCNGRCRSYKGFVWKFLEKA
jgi:group I intron endonuclease